VTHYFYFFCVFWGVFLAWVVLNDIIMRTLTMTNTLFDHFLTNWDKAFFDEDYSYWRRNDSSINCREKENSYEYYVPLAGFKKEDIAARLDEGRVHVVAKRYENTASYSFALPDEVDLSNMSAKHEDGLLTVTIPKTEKAKAITIAID
jgi:HSP20 family protein